MLKTRLRRFFLVFCFPVLVFSGCGSGGDSPPSVIVGPAAAINYSPSAYDFGDVTLNNSPAAKEITLSNSGSAVLDISDLILDGDSFVLALNGSDSYCGPTPFSIPVGGSCVVAVDFEPISVMSYVGALTVLSNDPVSPSISVPLSGNGLAVSSPIVRINQVEPDACPSSVLTVYVSATDQAGYSLSGLPLSSFSLSETDHDSADPISTINSLDFVGAVQAPISVALVMDYSSSITLDLPVAEAMEDGVISFVNQLTAIDEAEIVKFDNVVEVVQPFILGDAIGKEALIAKVNEDWDFGTKTRVYDAVYQAVEDTATRPSERRAVIVLSDGYDFDDVDTQLSTHSLQEVIDFAAASDVPIFTIGIGSEKKADILTKLSNDTGGQYYDAPGADTLRTIYQQQAEILFIDQYVLTYDSVFNPGESAILTVGLKLDEQTEVVYNSRTIVPCP